MPWGMDRQSSDEHGEGKDRREWKGEGKGRSWSKSGNEVSKGDGSYHDQKGWHQRDQQGSYSNSGAHKGWGQAGSGQGWTKTSKDTVASPNKEQEAASPKSEVDADGWTTVSKTTRGKNLPEISTGGAHAAHADNLKTPHLQTQGNSFVTPDVSTKQSAWGRSGAQHNGGWTRTKYNNQYDKSHAEAMEKETSWRSPSKRNQKDRTNSDAKIEIQMRIEEGASAGGAPRKMSYADA